MRPLSFFAHYQMVSAFSSDSPPGYGDARNTPVLERSWYSTHPRLRLLRARYETFVEALGWRYRQAGAALVVQGATVATRPNASRALGATGARRAVRPSRGLIRVIPVETT
jgi:hypothetical protein